MLAKYKETHRLSSKKWAENNRDRINTKRRERRAKLKAEKMKDKYCLLCEIRMIGNSYQTRLYCKDCNERYAYKINRDKCRRYYLKKICVQRAMRNFKSKTYIPRDMKFNEPIRS